MRILALTVAAVLALGTGQPAAAAAAPGTVASGDVGVLERLDAQVPLDLALTDEEGRAVTLGSLIDRPTVLSLNYFRCAGLCTPQLNGLAKVIGQLALDPARDFRVLTVSFDERDTPEIAARKRENYLKTMKRPIPPAAWRFLTGDAASTRALADAVGFGFRREGEDFAHPGVLVVLSPAGRVMRYLHGVHYLEADLRLAIAEAARGESRPAIAKFASFCYSYDPVSRRYAVDATRVAGLGLLAALAAFLAFVVLRKAPAPAGGKR